MQRKEEAQVQKRRIHYLETEAIGLWELSQVVQGDHVKHPEGLIRTEKSLSWYSAYARCNQYIHEILKGPSKVPALLIQEHTAVIRSPLDEASDLEHFQISRLQGLFDLV